jgi:hypothetical protein
MRARCDGPGSHLFPVYPAVAVAIVVEPLPPLDLRAVAIALDNALRRIAVRMLHNPLEPLHKPYLEFFTVPQFPSIG